MSRRLTKMIPLIYRWSSTRLTVCESETRGSIRHFCAKSCASLFRRLPWRVVNVSGGSTRSLAVIDPEHVGIERREPVVGHIQRAGEKPRQGLCRWFIAPIHPWPWPRHYLQKLSDNLFQSCLMRRFPDFDWTWKNGMKRVQLP